MQKSRTVYGSIGVALCSSITAMAANATDKSASFESLPVEYKQIDTVDKSSTSFPMISVERGSLLSCCGPSTGGI